jgi:hypothetical protein
MCYSLKFNRCRSRRGKKTRFKNRAAEKLDKLHIYIIIESSALKYLCESNQTDPGSICSNQVRVSLEPTNNRTLFKGHECLRGAFVSSAKAFVCDLIALMQSSMSNLKKRSKR